jgi:hypothetical protein
METSLDRDGALVIDCFTSFNDYKKQFSLSHNQQRAVWLNIFDLEVIRSVRDIVVTP